MQRTMDRGGHAEEVTLRLVQDHAAELLRFARRFSLCADDAHDAYQRGIEILVRRMRTSPPEHPLNWLRTVIRREASAVRMEREQLLGREEVDFDREEARDVEDPSDRVAGHERLGRVAEALQRLKSQEVTALVLRAEGLSYKEICARTGWTYTKTNRAITEGRRALRERLGAIESGAECDRWLPQLSLLADGEATARQVADLRPHLRGCPACRATLRGFHDAPRHVAALVPVALVPAGCGDPGATIGHLEAVVHALVERATFVVMRVQGALDTLPGAKVAAVAASTAALAGGGAAIEHATRQQPAARPAAQIVSAASPSADAFSVVNVPLARAEAATGSASSAADPRTATIGEFGVDGSTAHSSEFVRGTTQRATAHASMSSTPALASSAPTPAPAFSTPAPRVEPPGEFTGF